ncbi:unnamed protein product, partial [Amoebophrya sp. A25]|eukprot:GSA25T00022812001.1
MIKMVSVVPRLLLLCFFAVSAAAESASDEYVLRTAHWAICERALRGEEEQGPRSRSSRISGLESSNASCASKPCGCAGCLVSALAGTLQNLQLDHVKSRKVDHVAEKGQEHYVRKQVVQDHNYRRSSTGSAATAAAAASSPLPMQTKLEAIAVNH